MPAEPTRSGSRVLTPLFGLLFRFAVPVVADVLMEQLEFDLVPYYPLIMSFLGLIMAGILGTVIGFLLLNRVNADTLPVWACYDYLVLFTHLPMLRIAFPPTVTVLIAEVAKVLATSVDSVKCRVYRAREHLRKRLIAYKEPKA